MARLPLGRQDFKLDATSVKLGGEILVLYNVNLPELLVDNEADRERALEIVKNLVQTDFEGNRVDYQITASYMLKNAVTGQTKLWRGSFFTSENSPAEITQFKQFNPSTFVQTALGETSGENVRERLRWFGNNSVWAFESLESAIVNIQTVLPSSHPVFRRRGLKKQGKHISVPLG